MWRNASGYVIDEARVPTLFDPVAAQSFKDLAAIIIDGHLSRGRRGLAVCGTSNGAGVSYVTTNLAAALAVSGTPTLLVDANLHAPELDTAIRPPTPAQGLADYLLDEGLEFPQIVHSQIVPDLDLVYAGTNPAGAADRLGTAKFPEFVESCLRTSSCTIFDTAAANRSADVRVVANAVGYALLICRKGRTFVEDTALLSDQLRQDGVVVVGTLLNRG